MRSPYNDYDVSPDNEREFHNGTYLVCGGSGQSPCATIKYDQKIGAATLLNLSFPGWQLFILKTATKRLAINFFYSLCCRISGLYGCFKGWIDRIISCQNE